MLHGNISRTDGRHNLAGTEAAHGTDTRRRSAPLLPSGFAARIASGDRSISTAARILKISREGADVEVMFPSKGPPVILLFDRKNYDIYECEVRWRTDAFIGVRFLDILGAGRRRLFFADQPVPLRQLPNGTIRRNEPPRDDGPSSLSDPIWRTAAGESISLRSSTPGAARGALDVAKINRRIPLERISPGS